MTAPLVTVLTPVYNGEAYLAECIESVLAQTYDRFDYVIVDNASTDKTADILEEYAGRDPRIRVVRNDHLVPVVENHNIALRNTSPAAAWCKLVSADDVLMPECLEKMVSLALAHPSVGLVAAYQMQAARVALVGLPFPSPVTPGRYVGRASLLGRLSVFGNPTAHMLRADYVRGRDPFYDESTIHADEASCYEILQTADFGFVHQVLTYQRVHRGTVTFSVARRLNTYLLAHMKILTSYGRVYLSADEYERVVEQRMDVYYKFLARALLSPARQEIWEHHTRGLAALGIAVRRDRLTRAILGELGRAVLAPATYARKIARVMGSGADDEVSWREWWAPTGFEPIKNLPASKPRAA
jgi:glycosyltransferase involved in cell wall biosynthesis